MKITENQVEIVAGHLRTLGWSVGGDYDEDFKPDVRAALEHLATHPHSPDAADSGRAGDEVQQQVAANGNFSLSESPDLWPEWIHRAIREAVEEALAAQGQGYPIPMVLHCPSCGMQHIDAPEETVSVHLDGHESRWDNPPHRSHLCHGCGTVWRPADVPTVGVAAVNTKGNADVVKLAPPASPAGVPDGWVLVPSKSTDAMHKAYTAEKYRTRPDGAPVLISELWKAMLAAAPSAPEGGEVGL